MTELDDLLAGIVGDPLAEDRWGVLADWLEENDDPRRAELLRLHRRMLATCCEPEAQPERAAWQARIVELLATGVEPCVPRRGVVLAQGVEMRFSFIPPGSFLMGSPEGEPERENDEVRHRVTLTRGFWLGSHQVAQAQWRTVMGENLSEFKADSNPAEFVSWEDCQTFCRKLSEKASGQFRLPTEAEWEYACRAGTTTPFYFGEAISAEQANYDGNYVYGEGSEGIYRGKTTPVGSFLGNAWGLYDMHGNVLEWCEDLYADYSTEDIKDPQCGNNGTMRVLRGGSWCNEPKECRSAYRCWTDPWLHYGVFGCRVVLCPD